MVQLKQTYMELTCKDHVILLELPSNQENGLKLWELTGPKTEILSYSGGRGNSFSRKKHFTDVLRILNIFNNTKEVLRINSGENKVKKGKKTTFNY